MINSGLTLHLHPYKFSGGCFGSLQCLTPLPSGLYLTLNCDMSWPTSFFLLCFVFFSTLSNMFKDHHRDTAGLWSLWQPTSSSFSLSLKVGDKWDKGLLVSFVLLTIHNKPISKSDYGFSQWHWQWFPILRNVQINMRRIFNELVVWYSVRIKKLSIWNLNVFN